MTDIEKLRELLAAATPGPWKHIPGKRMVFVVAPECHVYSNRDNDDGEGPYHPNTIKRWNADAALIVAAVNALPKLLAENARLREALQAIHDRHIPDQPAAYDVSEADYTRKHHMDLRMLARAALKDTGQ